jgi:hypothetical protein
MNSSKIPQNLPQNSSKFLKIPQNSSKFQNSSIHTELNCDSNTVETTKYCSFCNKKLANKWNLIRHMNTCKIKKE